MIYDRVYANDPGYDARLADHQGRKCSCVKPGSFAYDQGYIIWLLIGNNFSINKSVIFSSTIPLQWKTASGRNTNRQKKQSTVLSHGLRLQGQGIIDVKEWTSSSRTSWFLLFHFSFKGYCNDINYMSNPWINYSITHEQKSIYHIIRQHLILVPFSCCHYQRLGLCTTHTSSSGQSRVGQTGVFYIIWTLSRFKVMRKGELRLLDINAAKSDPT